MSRDALVGHPGAGLRVVYITGASRCGSTALATLLGSQQESVGVGELSQLHKWGWLRDDYCACGNTCTRCPFWGAVLEQWQRQSPRADVAAYVGLQSKLERLRSWPRLRLAAIRKSAVFREYLYQTGALLEAISAICGKRIIVDSSKSAVRPWALSQIPGVDVRVVHLVRDVRATAWSQAKSYAPDPRMGIASEKPSRAIWKSSLEWMLANVLAEQLAPADRRCLIQYEDLVNRPEHVLSHLQAALELDLQGVISAVMSDEAVPVGHQIAGNRLRMQGAVRLRGDREWMTAMPAQDRERCWRIAGWLARRYGYQRTFSDAQGVGAKSTPARPQQRQLPVEAHFELVSSNGGVPCSNG